MKKCLIGLVVLLIFTSCATMSKSEMVISGQWLLDDGAGTSTLWDFKTHNRLHLLAYLFNNKTVDKTLKYRINGNELILDYGFGVTQKMYFDLSTPGVLKFENYMGLQGFNTQFYNFNVDIKEFTTLERATDIENALENASKKIMTSLQKGKNIAISNISVEDKNQSEFIANELEFILVEAGFSLVDRSQLDVIRKEQNFQLSGEVDDNQIVSIGRFAGANYIITGSISGLETARRLRLRLLDIETSRVLAVASERF